MKKAKGNFDLLLKMKQSKKKADKDVEEVEVDIESLSYRELQELAQENNIVANQKKPELIKELKEVLQWLLQEYLIRRCNLITAEELLYLKWLNDICNTSYIEADIPAGFELAIANLIASGVEKGYTSKSIQDMSVSFLQADDKMKATVYNYVYPYMKLKW